MSDDVTCEHYGLLGWRRRGHVAPEEWYFEAELKIAALTAQPDGNARAQESAPTAPSRDSAQETSTHGTINLTHVPVALVRHIVRCSVLMELQPGRETWHPDRRADVVASRVIDQLSMPWETLGENDLLNGETLGEDDLLNEKIR